MFYIDPKKYDAILDYGNTGHATIFVIGRTADTVHAGDKILMRIIRKDHTTILKRILDIESVVKEDGTPALAFSINFTHEQSEAIPVGSYLWDCSVYTNPIIVDGELTNGTIVETPRGVRMRPFTVRDISSKEEDE